MNDSEKNYQRYWKYNGLTKNDVLIRIALLMTFVNFVLAFAHIIHDTLEFAEMHTQIDHCQADIGTIMRNGCCDTHYDMYRPNEYRPPEYQADR